MKLKSPVVLLLSLCMFVTTIQAAEIKVYAAASLTNSLNALIQTYQQRYPQDKVIAIYGSSGTLAKQLVAGAPADIFISADQDWMRYLIQNQSIQANQQQVLLSNQLVLIAPKTSQQKIKIQTKPTLAQQSNGYICLGQMQSVPAGKYAKQSLSYFNWQNDLQGRLVETDNVRSALAFVERGECSIGIVYKTDALISKSVKTIGVFPTYSHLPIQYSTALTLQGQQQSSAQQFMQYLKSHKAKQIFQSFGFQWALP